jgi:hypothetical protein
MHLHNSPSIGSAGFQPAFSVSLQANRHLAGKIMYGRSIAAPHFSQIAALAFFFSAVNTTSIPPSSQNVLRYP